MIFTRIGTFGLFVALALAMFAWQANDLMAVLNESPFPLATAGVIGASLLVLLGMVLLNKRFSADSQSTNPSQFLRDNFFHLLISMMVSLGTGRVVVFVRIAKSNARTLMLALAGLPLLPITMLVGGGLSLAGRGGDQQRTTWDSVLAIGAIATLCVGLPIGLGLVFMGGGFGLTAGWAGIKAQFFLVVDYFLVRSLLHFFASGASAFISLRYLRRRVMSILSVVGILLGVLVLIVVNSVMSGFQQDFREQIRGSLSHVLVRFDSQQIRSSIKRTEERKAEWVAYITAINGKKGLKSDWLDIEDRALEEFRKLQAEDKDGDRVADFLRAQPPMGPDEQPAEPEDGLTDAEKAFLDRVHTGEFLSISEAECLRDDKGRITPKAFYLERIVDGAERSKAEAEITQSWFWPLFRQRMAHDFDVAEKSIKRHKNAQGEFDVIGVSPRVSTQTFITPRGGKTKELPIAQLIGVDVLSETKISNLGKYVADAEIHSFREQYTLKPLRNILGATLGWETKDSLDATGAKPAFLFLEEGKPLGFQRMPGDLSRDLKRRRLVTGVGKIRWAAFDNVEFWEFTPAQQIYERVQEAYKAAERTEDYAEMKDILQSCVDDVSAIVADKAKSKASSREEQMIQKGCKIIRDTYLTTIDLVYRERDYIYRKIVSETLSETINAEIEDDAGKMVPLLQPWPLKQFEALRKTINTLFKASKSKSIDTSITEKARFESFIQLLKDVLKAAEATERELVKAGFENSAMQISSLRDDVEISRDNPIIEIMLNNRSSLPAQYLLEVFDAGIESSRVRFDAYQKVLPLRTSLMPGESAEKYLKRAVIPGQRPSAKRPGIILGDALAKSPALSGVKVGDSIAITIPRIFYDSSMRLVPRTTEVWFEVTGFFRSGLFEDNLGKMYCDFEELAKVMADSEVRFYLGAKLKDYTPYEGTVAGAELKEDIRQELKSVGLHAYVTVWEDEKRTLLDAVNREKMILGLIVSMIILLAGGGIVIVIYQLVNEKVRDIGILKSLGQSPWGIRSLFMFNALFIGVFGAAIGAAAGIGMSEYLNEIEDIIDRLTGIRLFPEDIYFLTYIPTIKGMELLKLALDIAMPVVMFSFFCGIFPAMLAARKDPVEALHHE